MIIVWDGEDIRNALLAANEASAATALAARDFGADTERMRDYREGYKAALVTVALAFGIAPQAINLRQPETAEAPIIEATGEPTQLSVPQKFIERG